MRSFRSFTKRWPISALCIAVLLGPIFIGLFQSPASAQTGTIEVAVVDFRNLTKVADGMYAKMATDAVVVELLRSGKFSVTLDDALKAKMVELGYKNQEDQTASVNFTESDLQRLGQDVGATSVITGNLISIKVDEKKKKAEVRLSVRMIDVSSGAWVNGSAAIGVSHSRSSYEGQKDADWIIEAISDAARKSVETMVSYIIPEATVLGTYGTNEILLNKGSQDGIANNMEMIVIRRGETGIDEVVGKVKISSISDTDSHASIVNAPRGVKPGDQVRAIFSLPEIGETGEIDIAKAAKTEKRVAKSKNLLWGIIALVGIGSFMSGGSGRDESVSGGIAVAGASPDAGSSLGETGLMVLWDSLKDVRTQDIIEYHVWRDSLSYPVAVATEYTSIPHNGALGSFDHHVVLDTIGADAVDAQTASDDHTALEAITGDAVPGVSAGTPTRVSLSCVYQRYNSANATFTYWETIPSFCGVATLLDRPISLGPGGVVASETVNLDDITFQWIGSRGADTYVIEMCPFPDFRRSATWARTITQATPAENTQFSKSFGYTGSSDQYGIRAWIDSMQAIGKITSDDPVVYWRVGAKSSRDTNAPYPSGGVNAQLSGSLNTRYIYSDSNFSFNTDDDVPPPPEE